MNIELFKQEFTESEPSRLEIKQGETKGMLLVPPISAHISMCLQCAPLLSI